MDKKDSIFLTIEQAIEAVCLDFRQYDPQVLLFSEIINVLTEGHIIARREMGKNGIWIRRAGDLKMRWREGLDLIETMCEMVSDIRPDPITIASVCARVFRTRAFPDTDPASGVPGVRVLTGMEDFSCRQCGRCCQKLDYHDEISDEDVARWEQTGRSDILEWVGAFKKDTGGIVYRIWIRPGTRTFAETCPFLQKNPDNHLWACRIHDVKPRICREYPVSRKHAIMTGCIGFMSP
jgi:Fe-S-cluster containining protein